MSDTAFDIMLRDLRDRGCNRGEPCGVHESPQWTCGLCLHNVLAEVENQRIGAALHGSEAGPQEAREDVFDAVEDVLAKHCRGFMDRPTTRENIAELIDLICETYMREVQHRQKLQRVIEAGSEAGVSVRVLERIKAGPQEAREKYTHTDSEAAAWREIAERSDEAHAYCHAHNLRIGQNIWHAILDDAIRLRAELKKVSHD